MTDDGGVLGNLPRSRPGKRSEKRAAADTKQVGDATIRPSSRGGAPERSTPSRSGAATKRPSAQTRRRPRTPAGRSTDPVGGVIRGAAKAAQTGVRVAGAVTQEVLRRVPRP